MRAIVGGRVTLAGSIDTQAGRTICQHDGRDSQRIEGIGGTSSTGYETLGGTYHGIVAAEASHTNTNHEVCLVFKRHLGHHFLLIDGVLDSLVSSSAASHHDSQCPCQNN